MYVCVKTESNNSLLLEDREEEKAVCNSSPFLSVPASTYFPVFGQCARVYHASHLTLAKVEI